MSDKKKYWVGFNLVKGIGAVRLGMLLDHFSDIETAWLATPGELAAAGLSTKLVENLIVVRSGVSLDQIWEQINEKGIDVLTWKDEGYPRRLREIDQTPPVIYLHGDLRVEDEWAVAIVGTRRVTPYGRQVAEEVAIALARSGVTVISGLARGVDAIAHKAALNAGGRTIAVLGSGVDRIYPPEHRRLAQDLINNGALLSDYPPGTPPEGINFPPRNRIISGLSMAVVVVEAGGRSGALITAEFAANQGRDVFAVPGNIFSPQSAGTNRLIQQGARPLLNPGDVLDSLDLALVSEKQTARKVLPTDKTEAHILKILGHEPLHIDEIRNQSALPIEKVTATLTLMELKGMVSQVGGMNYVAIRESQGEYQVEEKDQNISPEDKSG